VGARGRRGKTQIRPRALIYLLPGSIDLRMQITGNSVQVSVHFISPDT
jgi:hypothetical protein